MRRERDITTAKIMDLGDQPPDDFLLYYSTPGGGTNIQWVHTFSIKEDCIEGRDARGRLIVSFSIRLPWAVIAKDRLDVFSVSDLQEMERVNIVDRVRVKKDYAQVENAAMRGDDADDRWNQEDLRG